MPDHRSSRPNYTREINQWGSDREGRQSFRDRARTSLFAPDIFAHPLTRLFGYLWRLGLVALVGALVYWLLLRVHLGGDTFARQLSVESQKLLGADSVKIPKVEWRGEMGTVRRLQATGGTGTFFRSLEASDITFKVPLSMLWSKEWRFRRITIGSLDLILRSGGLGGSAGVGLTEQEKETIPEGFEEPVSAINAKVDLDATAPETPPNPGEEETSAKGRKTLDLRLMKDGFGVAPDFDKLEINAFDANRLQINWGMSEGTFGALTDGSLNAVQKSPGDWTFEIPSATLGQNWLRGLQAKDLRVRYTDGTLEVEETAVRVGDGAATLSGRVLTGEVPRFELKLKADKLPFERFFGEPFDGFLHLVASGELAIGGSTNLASGITIKGDLVLNGGSLRNLPLQDALVNATKRERFRDIEFTSGRCTIATGEGRLEVTNIEVLSRDDIILKGELRWEKGTFSGTLDIGCNPALLQKAPEAVRTGFFQSESGGKLWISTPLVGPLDDLTKALASRILATVQNRTPR